MNTPADVLIIGAGPSGGVAALHLQQAGFRVVALEQGQWQDRANYRGSEWDWELSSGKQWSSLPNVRQHREDYPIDVSQSDMEVINFNGVGGSTVLYNAIWPRLLPENFKSKSLFGFGEDWPIDYGELQPFYEATDRQMGVSGFGGNPLYPQGAEPPLPPLPFGTGALRVARALHEKGWHWWPDTNAILSIPYDGRHQCVQRGACHTGCNEGAKASADLTHWRKFAAAGGELITGARVRRIVTDASGLACGAEWIDAQGQHHYQAANRVICAANGIGTPRLLLASANARQPEGLANSSGLVGRNLMMHPVAIVFGYFPDNIEGWQGQNGSTVQCQEFGLDDPSRGFRGGCKWSLHPMGAGPAMEAVKLLAGGTWGEDFHATFPARFGHGLMWSILAEDIPDPDNRVELSETRTDSSGLPIPQLHYRYDKDVLANMTWNCERAEEVFRAAGAVHVEILNPAGANGHLTGTARMGYDPSTSVVDRWCFSHDVPNLAIVDGSVFVTSGAVNPTTTICALSLRAASHLVEHWNDLPFPDHGSAELAPDSANHPPGDAPRPVTLPAQFSRGQLDALTQLGDALIPAREDLPGAGTLLCQQGLLEKVLSVRPDLHAALDKVLALDTLTVESFYALATSDQEAWLDVLTAIANGYYLDPGVKAHIGYGGQTARPLQPEGYPRYVAEGLLDHLLDGTWQARRTTPPSQH